MFDSLSKKAAFLVFSLLMLAVFVGGCEEERASTKKLFDYRQIELDNGMKVLKIFPHLSSRCRSGTRSARKMKIPRDAVLLTCSSI